MVHAGRNGECAQRLPHGIDAVFQIGLEPIDLIVCRCADIAALEQCISAAILVAADEAVCNTALIAALPDGAVVASLLKITAHRAAANVHMGLGRV